MTKDEILKELDEQFLTNPKKQISLISGDEKRELSAFMVEKVFEGIEEVKNIIAQKRGYLLLKRSEEKAVDVLWDILSELKKIYQTMKEDHRWKG